MPRPVTPIVRVVWVAEDHDYHVETTSIGWLLGRDARGITIANEYVERTADYDGERDIPLECIRSLVDVKTGEPL